MTEQHDVSGGRTRPVAAAHARTMAFLGLGLGLVGLMGGGTFANALFFMTIDDASFGSSTSAVVQGLPGLAMGLIGAGLGWSAWTSDEEVAGPAGLAAGVLGGLAVLGSIAVILAGQA
ncbi:hypothetical protein [Nocardioides sediminis]|uniref:hypothetical protein n=1 Tax=Nocardioides sediminis TaxID=433648 RepID=UPI000D31B30F|nr:hypothetical protein [Nocardioides sediminis]